MTRFLPFILCFFTLAVFGQKCTEDLSSVRPRMEPKEITFSELEEDDEALMLLDSNLGREMMSEVELEIDSLADKLGEYRYVNGWRVQVYSGTDFNKSTEYTQKAAQILNEKLEKKNVPDIYNKLEKPVFRVKIGDFMKKLDAFRILVLLREEEGFEDALLVPDQIELEKID